MNLIKKGVQLLLVGNAPVAMDADNYALAIEAAIQRGIDFLSNIVRELLYKDIELLRVCRTAVLLKKSGKNLDDSLYHELTEKCTKIQRNDGGWTDVEETIWCTTFLNFCNEFSDPVNKAFKWLRGQEHKDGGWGKSIRDTARIPVSALLLYFLPQISSVKDLKWMENKWYQEQKTEPCLTYKAAFTLMAFCKNNYHPEYNEIIPKTVHWLTGQQNDDGGWGPWKDHPVGSDPWCTGICLVSLLQYPDELPQKVLRNGLEWIKEKQLPNGLWAYHYIEDGSAWTLYALTMGYSLLSKRKND